MAEPPSEFLQQSPSTVDVQKEMLKTNMINRLAHSEAHFKHQQRGEADLSIEEKCNIAHRLLEKSDALFLERFSKYLSIEDVEYFSDSKDYNIKFYIQAIKENSNVNKSQNVIKNRRYQALQEMTEVGEYFSEEQMQKRDPLLFEQMIGQHESEEQKQAREVDKSDVRFSSILLRYMDIQERKELYDNLKDREEGQEEEEEESTESEEEDEVTVTHQHENTNNKSFGSKSEDDKEAKDRISIQEQGLLRGEFLRIMQERFLSGKDKQFDYSKVDNNTMYDSLDILNQDAEDMYFDTDDSPRQTQNLVMDTGQ